MMISFVTFKIPILTVHWLIVCRLSVFWMFYLTNSFKLNNLIEKLLVKQHPKVM